jgi:hypothetical protein
MYEERLGFQSWQEKQQALVDGVRDHADKVRRKTVLVVRFNAKNYHFTKTGSGQTSEKLKKSTVCLIVATTVTRNRPGVAEVGALAAVRIAEHR